MSECQCPTPPGGRVVCAPYQTAFCIIDPQGHVTTGCNDAPQTARTRRNLENWALQEVTGRKRAPGQLITLADRAILQSGYYERQDGTRVTFQLPRNDANPNDFGPFGGSPQSGGFNPPRGGTVSA